MGKIIKILHVAPAVFTKDKDWGAHVKLMPGAIVVLPDDAVLFAAPDPNPLPAPNQIKPAKKKAGRE